MRRRLGGGRAREEEVGRLAARRRPGARGGAPQRVGRLGWGGGQARDFRICDEFFLLRIHDVFYCDVNM